jgi:hypothetical protein
MGLFSKKPNTDKILNEALCDYKASRFEECYKKVCEACDAGSARAHFCKALLIYNDSIAPNSVPDFDVLRALTKTAVDGGYALAYGFYAYVLHAIGDTDALCEFLSKKCKVRDGLYLSFRASYLFGLYTDKEMGDKKSVLSAIREAISSIKDLNSSIENKKSLENEERSLYNPYTKFSIRYCYAHANFVLLTVHYCEDDWSTRREFMDAFEEIINYMPLVKEKYNAASQYLRAILNNYLGMQDFQEANRAMSILNACYNDLSDEEKEAVDADYDELYASYDEFYDLSSEEIRNREVTYSDGYASKNDISLGNIASAITEGASRWANSAPSSTKSVYTIDGKRYTRGEDGYLYGEDNMNSGYRVDDYSRLYNQNDTELGYFNNDGLFIDN